MGRAEGPSGSDLAQRAAEMGTLANPLRRSLYLHVAGQGHEVSRDEAAAATGISRSVAAFHLDKLVEGGLLEASFRRLSGRGGPGAGRPSKLYRRSSRQLEVSLPPRNYQLVAELLAQAVEEAGDRPIRPSLNRVARRFGRELGRLIRSGLLRRTGRRRQLAALAGGLDRFGYEAHEQSGRLRLRNCPFRALAEGHRDLVCKMNLALIKGVVAGMGADRLEARQEATPGQCCVVVEAIGPAPEGQRGTRSSGGNRRSQRREAP